MLLENEMESPGANSERGTVEALMSDLLRILFQKHFGYEGCLMLGNSISQNAIKRSSMVLALADSIGEFLYKEEKIKISEYNTQLLGVSLYKVIV